MLRSKSHSDGIKAVLSNKSGGRVDTSFYTLDFEEGHRVIGVPVSEAVKLSNINWHISTLECQILGLVKDIALVDLENSKGTSNSDILTYRNNMVARLDKLVALDPKLRYYTDSVCGYDANNFYVIADKSVAALRPIWAERNELKSSIVNWMLNRIANDFDFPVADVLPELQKSDIADWLNSATVYQIPRNAVMGATITTITPELEEWMVRQFTTGSRTVGREISAEVVEHCAQFGVSKEDRPMDHTLNALRSIDMGYIEQVVSGDASNGEFILAYSGMVLTESTIGSKTFSNGATRFVFRKTRDTLIDDWNQLESLSSVTLAEYTAWTKELDKQLAAVWQLSWAKRRAGELTEYTPGALLTSRYVIHQVNPLQCAFMREAGDLVDAGR